MLPWVVGETVFPRRSATDRIGESFGTSSASPPWLGDRVASTILMRSVEDSAVRVGASPATPTSIASLRSASSSGAAAGNCAHSTRYGAPSSAPEALSRACWMPAWSPTRRVTCGQVDRAVVGGAGAAGQQQRQRGEQGGQGEQRTAGHGVVSGSVSGVSEGRFTTIPSCVLREMTTTAGTSGSGFSSRCGTHGGTNT